MRRMIESLLARWLPTAPRAPRRPVPEGLRRQLRSLPSHRMSCGEALDHWTMVASLAVPNDPSLDRPVPMDALLGGPLPATLDPVDSKRLVPRFGVDSQAPVLAAREHLENCSSCRRTVRVLASTLSAPVPRRAVPAATIDALRALPRRPVPLAPWVREPRWAFAASLLLFSLLSPWVLSAHGEIGVGLAQRVKASSQRLVAGLEPVESLAVQAFRPLPPTSALAGVNLFSRSKVDPLSTPDPYPVPASISSAQSSATDDSILTIDPGVEDAFPGAAADSKEMSQDEHPER